MAKSRVQHGKDLQRWVAEFLIEQGYAVHNQLPASKPIYEPGHWGDTSFIKRWTSSRNDLFSAFDICATKQGIKPLWIQVTAHSGVGEKLKDILTVPLDLAYNDIQVWQTPESGRWRLFSFNGTGLTQYAEIVRRKIMYLGNWGQSETK